MRPRADPVRRGRATISSRRSRNTTLSGSPATIGWRGCVRNDLRGPDRVPPMAQSQQMVAKNPKAGRGPYLYRWRYSGILVRCPPDAKRPPIKALAQLAPDDPEVPSSPWPLQLSEEKPDLAAARGYPTEKGLQARSQKHRLGPRPGSPGDSGTTPRSGLRIRLATSLSGSQVPLLRPGLHLGGNPDPSGQDRRQGPGRRVHRPRSAVVGLGDTYVRYLEAEILFQRQKWTEAIPKIETARAVLRADAQLTSQLNLMLAECYGRVGSDENSGSMPSGRPPPEIELGFRPSGFRSSHSPVRQIGPGYFYSFFINE